MKLLSRSEEIILAAILNLQDNAYGITIRNFIRDATGSEWSFAQIYEPLSRLTRRGYVLKSKGEPTPERGGRHKCLYRITDEGKEALRILKEVQQKIWNSIPKKALS